MASWGFSSHKSRDEGNHHVGKKVLKSSTILTVVMVYLIQQGLEYLAHLYQTNGSLDPLRSMQLRNAFHKYKTLSVLANVGNAILTNPSSCF